MDKMKKKRSKWFVAIAAAVTVAVIAGIFALLILLDRGSEVTFRQPVYFFNTATGTLESEIYESSFTAQTDLLNDAVAKLFGTPRSPNLTRPWPEAEGLLIGCNMNGNILEATFTDAYDELEPLTEALLRTAFVNTMTHLPFVDYVRIFRENADETEFADYLSPANNLINPKNITPARINTREFTLFFVNENADGLVAEEHSSDEVDIDQMEAYIVTQLIKGQTAEGHYPAIPPDVTVISASTDETVCYINLSEEFNKFNGSANLTELMLYSIVNSLTENLVNVKRVQFQINSEMVEAFKGVADFNLPFERNAGLIPVIPE